MLEVTKLYFYSQTTFNTAIVSDVKKAIRILQNVCKMPYHYKKTIIRNWYEKTCKCILQAWLNKLNDFKREREKERERERERERETLERHSSMQPRNKIFQLEK